MVGRARVSSGVPSGGEFTAAVHSECDLDLGPAPGQLRCASCGRFRPAANPHRCPAPGLVPLSPATQALLDAICTTGGRPLIVGGSVRDALLAQTWGRRIEPKDIDIEVYGADPAALSQALGRVGRVDEVGVSFGVLKVNVDGEDFDVSVPRTDSKTGTGHRGFSVRIDHGLPEVEAFGRRDFTINAMGWDPDSEELVDPYCGSADLAAGLLRHTTEAFDEDPLRVLRAVQFAGRFGFDVAPETTSRCKDLAGAFVELPRDRVWGEWCKVATKARWPSKSLQALYEVGWEQHFPELAAVRDVPQDHFWHPEGPVHVHLGLAANAAAQAADDAGLDAEQRTIVVLGAMLHDLGKASSTQLPGEPGGRITSHGHADAGQEPVRSFLRRNGSPERFAPMIVPIIAEHMCVTGTQRPTLPAVRRLARRLAGPGGHGPTLTQLAAVVAADHAGRGSASHPSPADAWLSVAGTAGETLAPRPGLLTGSHLIAAGLRPGPEFRPLLAAALQAQDDGEFDDEVGALVWFAARRPGAS